MHNAIRAMSPRTKMTIFWCLFGAAILLAVLPPLYLAGSGISTSVFGVPFSVAYWIFDGLLAVGAVSQLWIFENIFDVARSTVYRAIKRAEPARRGRDRTPSQARAASAT